MGLKTVLRYRGACDSEMLVYAGNYMMTIGQLDSTGQQPVIHAMKLHNLSSDVALQTMWPLEVHNIRLHTK